MGAINRALDMQNRATGGGENRSAGAGRDTHSLLAQSQIPLGAAAHPGIVQHVDATASSQDGTLFLAMEWLEGEDLVDRLPRGPPRRRGERSALARDLRGALPGAPGRHRAPRSQARESLPQARRPGPGEDSRFRHCSVNSELRSLTDPGTLLGTVGYMSPEQASSRSGLDSRADVFALGCVLYECLTGQAPFSSAHPIGVLAKVLHEEPARLSDVVPELHSALDELVTRMLAKRRDERLCDARAVLDALAAPRRRGVRADRPQAATGRVLPALGAAHRERHLRQVSRVTIGPFPRASPRRVSSSRSATRRRWRRSRAARS